ncbi:MAG: Rieske (2Fe-2S) protein, partial [Verrucomicrobiota bacterium]
PSLLIRHPTGPFPISLLRTGEGSYTACLMSCTHQLCTTIYRESFYLCPCHGSRFTHAGKVTRGPATRDLTTYPVVVTADEIRILLLDLKTNN